VLVPYKSGTPCTGSKSRQRADHASAHCHMAHSSRSRLPMREGSGAVTCHTALSGLWACTGHTVRAVHYRGKHARHQVKPSSWTCKTCDRRRIKCLQDMRTDSYRTATVQHPLVNHSRCVTTVPSDLTAQVRQNCCCARRHNSSAPNCAWAQRGMATGQDRTFSTPLKTSFTTLS
jgi:hypothetical protein